MLARQLAGVLLTSLVFAGTAVALETQELRTFDVPPGTRVRISNQDGAVRVTSWEQSQVRLIARRKARAMSREMERKLLSLMQVRAEMRGPDLFIEGRVESVSIFGFASYSLELEVTVPRKLDMQVRCRDGSVELTGLVGSLDARTRDGSIRARDLTGDIAIATQDGSLDLDEVNTRVRAETSDGSIRYRGRPERLELRTSDGSIHAEVLPGAQMAGNWSLRTSDGSISLMLPRDLSANLEADTESGHVVVELPGIERAGRSRERYTGKLNGGSYILSVHTNDGSVRVSGR